MTEEEFQAMVKEVLNEQEAEPSPQVGSSASPAASTSNATLKALIAAKGAPMQTGASPRTDEFGSILGSTITRYVWADGTYVDIDDKTGMPHGGTALTTLKQPTASSQRPTGISGATGNKAQFPVAMPDGSVQWIADPNYDPEMSAIEKAKKQNDLIRDMFQDLLDQRKFTRQQLEAAYAENYKQLDAQIRIDMQALARESQTQDYAQRMGQAGANTAMQALPYMVPKGTTANLNKAIASMGSGSSAPVQYDPIEPQPFPFGDPTNLANNIALRAAAQWSPMAREQLGMPAPTGFKVPPLMLQEPVGVPGLAQAQGQAAEMIAAQPNAGVGFRAPTLEEIQRAGPNSALYGAPW